MCWHGVLRRPCESVTTSSYMIHKSCGACGVRAMSVRRLPRGLLGTLSSVAVSATPDSITALPCRPFFAIVLVGVVLQYVFFSTRRRPGLRKYIVQLPKISLSPGVRRTGCPYCMLAGKRMRHVLVRPLYIPMCNNHASFHVVFHAHVRSLRNNTASYPQQHRKLPATHRNHPQEAVPCRMKPRQQKRETPRYRCDTALDTATLPQQHAVTHRTKTRDAAQY